MENKRVSSDRFLRFPFACLACGALPLGIFTICCLIIGVLSFFGQINRQPERVALADDLLIDPTNFPANWNVTIQDSTRPCATAPLGSGCRAYKTLKRFVQYGISNDHGMQEVQVHLSESKAETEYLMELDEEFWFDSRGTEWTTPDVFNAGSLRADQSYAACHLYHEAQECQLIARYQEFVILYRTTATGMSQEEVWSIFNLVDHRISRFLAQSDG